MIEHFGSLSMLIKTKVLTQEAKSAKGMTASPQRSRLSSKLSVGFTYSQYMTKTVSLNPLGEASTFHN